MTDTLKSICEQCTNLQNPPLDFIRDDLLQNSEIIRRDISQLLLAASADSDKAVLLLAGSLLEAVLYSFLKSQENFISQRKGSNFTLQLEESLQYFKDTFNRWFSGLIPNSKLPDLIVEYRDLVHINNELDSMNSTPDICAQGSRALLLTLDNLIGGLAAYARH